MTPGWIGVACGRPCCRYLEEAVGAAEGKMNITIALNKGVAISRVRRSSNRLIVYLVVAATRRVQTVLVWILVKNLPLELGQRHHSRRTTIRIVTPRRTMRGWWCECWRKAKKSKGSNENGQEPSTQFGERPSHSVFASSLPSEEIRMPANRMGRGFLTKRTKLPRDSGAALEYKAWRTHSTPYIFLRAVVYILLSKACPGDLFFCQTE